MALSTGLLRMEGLKVSKAKLVVYVHPSNAGRPDEAVRRQLAASLFAYDDTFDGVVLAYSFEVASRKARILNGLIPHFGVNVVAQMLLFSPKPGMLLEGKVAKLGKESIHLVVLGICSAAIMLEDIRKKFVYRIKGGKGVFASKTHSKHVIKTGGMVRFSVKCFDEEILHISGSLAPRNSGCIRWLSRHHTEDSQTHRNLTEEHSGDESAASRPHKSRRTT